jgi:hypothetical protein
MPLEGHWQRVNTPLRRLTRREHRFAVGGLALVVAATLAIVLLAVSTSAPRLAPGCIDAIIPGAMGGVPVDACGARARATCRSHANQVDPGSLAIEASCRRAGLVR